MFGIALTIMKKVAVWQLISASFFIATFSLPAYSSNEFSGKSQWYDFRDEGRAAYLDARASYRPVLVLYYAPWSSNCDRFISELESTEIFSSIRKKFVLLKVDVSSSEGREAGNRENIRVFPTAKVLDYKGGVLGRCSPVRNSAQLEKFLKDIVVPALIKLIRKDLELQPYNRKLNFELTAHLGLKDIDRRIDLLKVAAGVVPEYSDSFTQKIYEYLAADIIFSYSNKDGLTRENFAQLNKPVLLNLISAYYPDFKYRLRGCQGVAMLIGWFNSLKDHSTAYRLFRTYAEKREWYKEESAIDFLEEGLSSVSRSDKFRNLHDELMKLSSYYRSIEPGKVETGKYLNIIKSFIYYCCRRGDTDSESVYVKLFLEEADRLGVGKDAERQVVEWAVKTGFCICEALAILNRDLADSSEEVRMRAALSKMSLLAGRKRGDEAVDFIKSFLGKIERSRMPAGKLQNFYLKVTEIITDNELTVNGSLL